MSELAELKARIALKQALESKDEAAELDARIALQRATQGAVSGPIDAGVSGVNRAVTQTADLVVGNPLAGIANLVPGVNIQRDPITRTAQSVGIGRETPGSPISSRIGEEVGNAVAPGGIVLKYARHAPRVLQQMLQQAQTAPGRFAASEGIAALGAGTGAAVAQNVEPGNRLAEGVLQVVGGMTPSAVAGGVRRVLAGNPAEVARRADVFARAGVDPTAGQVGSSTAQVVDGSLRVAPGSTSVMADTAERQADQLSARVSGIAGDVGEEQAGNTITRGVREFVDGVPQPNGTTTGGRMARSGELWDHVDALVPPESTVDISNTQRTLDELSGGSPLAQIFTSPTVRQAAQAVEDAGGEATYGELRALRTAIGRRLGSPDLISDVPKSQLKQLYGAITRDVRAAAAGVDGGERAFARANKYTRALHDRVDSVLQPILRRTTPEKVFQTVRKSDASTLLRLRRSLDPSDWRTVTDAVVSDLGTAVASKQDDVGGVFSPETFLTQWNRLGERTRRALFGARNFEQYDRDLRTVAEAMSLMRRNAEVLANPSGTARAASNSAAAASAATALFTGQFGVAAGIGATAGALNLTARQFASPRFIRWLATTTNSAPERLPVLLVRLGEMMRSEPEATQADIMQMIQSVRP